VEGGRGEEGIESVCRPTGDTDPRKLQAHAAGMYMIAVLVVLVVLVVLAVLVVLVVLV
jgi:type II secretory pathway pseudopilin PulG